VAPTPSRCFARHDPKDTTMRRPPLHLALAVAAGLLLTACGGGNDDAGEDGATGATGATGVTVVATEFAFDPSELSIAADTAVEIVLDNQGVVEHDLTVDELDLEIYVAAGETVTETVTVPAGTYEMYCSIPGHRASGMEGTLTVG
jgi:plastocyanin